MIQKGIILGLLLTIGIVLTYNAIQKHQPPYTPKYTRGDCFLFRSHQATHPDGYITYQHDDYYTVMWYKEAYRRYGGIKEGYDVPLKWLDEYSYGIPCPQLKSKGGK